MKFCPQYVNFVKSRGRVTEVIFITEFISDRRKYTLKEHYGYGYVQYHLYTENGSEINANAIPQTVWITSDTVIFDKSIMLAVPCIYGTSPIFEGRGENIFDSKIDSFDALDLCLQGIVSPSTLGIDVKKMDNAEAQREKEKTTLYTRGNLVNFIDGVMQKLVLSALAGYHIWHNESFDGSLKCSVKFGEYANPSFEAVVIWLKQLKTVKKMI